jgi:hypothetical protein
VDFFGWIAISRSGLKAFAPAFLNSVLSDPLGVLSL